MDEGPCEMTFQIWREENERNDCGLLWRSKFEYEQPKLVRTQSHLHVAVSAQKSGTLQTCPAITAHASSGSRSAASLRLLTMRVPSIRIFGSIGGGCAKRLACRRSDRRGAPRLVPDGILHDGFRSMLDIASGEDVRVVLLLV